MRSIKVREVVEMIALHGLCTQISSDMANLPRAAKQVSDAWAKLNPEICDKECG